MTTNAEQLRKALKEIEKAEANGFLHCEAVFNLVKYGNSISDCKIEFIDISEKAHPTDGSLNWGRGQNVSKNHKFINAKLKPI